MTTLSSQTCPIDRDRLIVLGATACWYPSTDGQEILRRESENPAHLIHWLVEEGPRALVRVHQHLEAVDGTDLARLGRGIGREIGLWQVWKALRDHEIDPGSSYHHPNAYETFGEEFATAARELWAILDRRVGTDWRNATPECREVWLRFAWMACDGCERGMLGDSADRLLSAAGFELARMRGLLRNAAKPNAARQFETDLQHYTCCVEHLAAWGTLWEALKPLLLCLRALADPALTQDLRSWSEVTLNERAKEPWSIIPRNLVGIVHRCARREEQSDPKLTRCREEFARFCLDRIVETRKPRPDQDGDGLSLVEPSAHWRECAIRAAMALHINPERRGHRALYWSSQKDPDPHVKAAADVAHDRLRQQPDLPEGTSPRRAVIHALWWLFQAHLLALGTQPDADGAQRTLAIMVRRTTEKMNDERT